MIRPGIAHKEWWKTLLLLLLWGRGRTKVSMGVSKYIGWWDMHSLLTALLERLLTYCKRRKSAFSNSIFFLEILPYFPYKVSKISTEKIGCVLCSAHCCTVLNIPHLSDEVISGVLCDHQAVQGQDGLGVCSDPGNLPNTIVRSHTLHSHN